jgi:hypothetical protein
MNTRLVIEGEHRETLEQLRTTVKHSNLWNGEGGMSMHLETKCNTCGEFTHVALKHYCKKRPPMNEKEQTEFNNNLGAAWDILRDCAEMIYREDKDAWKKLRQTMIELKALQR